MFRNLVEYFLLSIVTAIAPFSAWSQGTKSDVTKTLRLEIPDLLPLAVRDAKALPHEGAGVLSQLACDQEGNPYFISLTHAYSGRTSLVTRWDLRDEKLVKFSFSGYPELADASLLSSYAVASDGSVYIPVAKMPSNGSVPEFYIARIKKSGEFVSLTRIAEDLAILQIGVFPTGDFIVVASRPQRKRITPEPPRQYVTALYRADGTFIKEIGAEQNPDVKAAIANRDPIYTNPNLPQPNDRTIETGSGRVGPDGLFYAMRRNTYADIYVYSGVGELVRRVRIDSPVASMRPAWFQVGQGMLAVYFLPETNGSGVIVVADSETGERRAVFDGAGHSQAFACFVAPRTITVLGSTRDGQLTAEILGPK